MRRGPGEPRLLQIVQMGTGAVVERVDISGKSPAEVDAITVKLRAKISEDEFYVEDTGYNRPFGEGQ